MPFLLGSLTRKVVRQACQSMRVNMVQPCPFRGWWKSIGLTFTAAQLPHQGVWVTPPDGLSSGIISRVGGLAASALMSNCQLEGEGVLPPERTALSADSGGVLSGGSTQSQKGKGSVKPYREEADIIEERLCAGKLARSADSRVFSQGQAPGGLARERERGAIFFCRFRGCFFQESIDMLGKASSSTLSV